MTASSKKKYQVVLNSAATGVDAGDNTREVTGTRFQRDAGGGVTVYDGDDEVAYFQYVTSITPA